MSETEYDVSIFNKLSSRPVLQNATVIRSELNTILKRFTNMPRVNRQIALDELDKRGMITLYSRPSEKRPFDITIHKIIHLEIIDWTRIDREWSEAIPTTGTSRLIEETMTKFWEDRGGRDRYFMTVKGVERKRHYFESEAEK